ncbi:MAG: DUF2194 domain-containing protein, partial [Candidatus Scalindua sp.]
MPCLATYIPQRGGRVRLLLNVEEFLREALFPQALEERVALLVDDTSLTGSRILNYTQAVLRLAKLPVEVFPKEQFQRLLPGDLRRFTAVGLILKNGFRFRYGFVLSEGLALENRKFGWVSATGQPAEEAEVPAYSFTGNSPLVWAAERGQGKVLTWNWKEFETGYFQGLILESFLFVRPVGVAATTGLGVMFIDDWPLPMYNVVKPPLSVTDTEFYTRTWWPDIK